MTMRILPHPGEILKREFLIPMAISQSLLARKIFVPASRISQLITGKRNMTPDTAARLGQFFGTSGQLWMNLQTNHELSKLKGSNT